MKAAVSTAIVVTCVCVAARSVQAAPAWERQLDMKAMAEATRTIGELFASKRPYSQKVFKAAAEAIKTRAGGNLTDAFAGEAQQGSKTDSGAIASSTEEFDKLARDLETYAAALSTAADRSPARLGPETRMGGTLLGSPFAPKAEASRDAAVVPAEHAYHLMLQTCTSCHAKFRRP